MRATVTLLTLLALVAASGSVRVDGLSRTERRGGDVPHARNVVVVMTDDMRFDDLAAMPFTERMFAEQGASFTRAYDDFPLCCPARATFLTGQYGHNHGVQSNHLDAVARFMNREPDDLLPGWLREQGYTTAMVGKYFNHYGERGDGVVPPEWDYWRALMYPQGNPSYYDYALNEDGHPRRYRKTRRNYLTTTLTGRAVDFIADRRKRENGKFFLWVSYFAPHVGEAVPYGDRQHRDPYNARGRYCAKGPKPAPGDLAAHLDDPQPARGGYDEDTSDKPDSIQRGALTRKERAAILRRHRCRRASLAEVDRGVREIVRALGPDLEDTLVVFLSDNGYLQGEHRVPLGKLEVYEESSRVPIMLRGPGVPAGVVDRAVVSNVDVASTIVEATGVEPGRELDGTSLLEVLAGTAVPRAGVLIRGGRYEAVHAGRWVWARREGGATERELYDLTSDPFQLDNLWDVRTGQPKPGYAGRVEELDALLGRLRDCNGELECSGSAD
jgi:arylsulfatase A-like enzyme